ncbi:acetyl-CoA carboxylase biotin carboxylase subunit [Salibacteraceae bacterium]|jgi:acetyl-CoA carboxylase, biotin carboxylase subunit|nr:acetyl-CoA carboxylase biotin carboxylase subunit [Salibacteraceae bacterium]MDB4104575.1 acetyl-CoA carboxylase biotin carboxylase subunit [Salibacteraceae bacterium]MDB9708613.1 acetyl-CoA carboxylase biotin carboxylase subunit [Salibacteraceae bacterium]MDC1304450.1 acetyl-CoA carboxylase biotin carboxylase subunit [Salibacteraceae bacterium]HAQ71483.1 acetyl-CoA carboxylase biotin carboxylase subunit [Flavobacteriales bacterium]
MKKILVANRGEIALRIMRTCREMNIKTVAVFSEADRNALFVRFADEAYCIGPPASSQSYLVIDKIIDVARKSGADGVHPGYGFLSENAAFARRLEQEGIELIGPSAHSMEVMGDKLSAKETALKQNVPLVPGSEGAVNSLEEAKVVAREVGFPLLIKASAGGGGKGMRAVYNEESIDEELHLAMSEAKSAFGDPSVFIERYVTSPRHIEVQILADKHGNCVYLFDRDCSIQRRHQKVIEEAPASVLTPEMRKKMGECAVSLAKGCNYKGAGTVEFLVDDKMDFFFLEMNTRLQVEHPVTEMITGIDLVKQQILVARGEKLAFTQEDLKIRGHALEVRVYAEDPRNNFLPDIGKLQTYRRPQGPGVRVDDGFEEGMNIPIYYDPMIAKLVTYAEDRITAIQRMTRAIDEYEISGVATTLEFCRFAINHEAFVSGNFDTHFVKDHFKPEYLDEPQIANEVALAAFIGSIALSSASNSESSNVQQKPITSKWKINRR